MSGSRVPADDRRAAMNAVMIARVRQLLDAGYTGPLTLHCKDGRLLRVEYRRIESVESVVKAAHKRAGARKPPAPRPRGRSRESSGEGGQEDSGQQA